MAIGRPKIHDTPEIRNQAYRDRFKQKIQDAVSVLSSTAEVLRSTANDLVDTAPARKYLTLIEAAKACEEAAKYLPYQEQ